MEWLEIMTNRMNHLKFWTQTVIEYQVSSLKRSQQFFTPEKLMVGRLDPFLLGQTAHFSGAMSCFIGSGDRLFIKSLEKNRKTLQEFHQPKLFRSEFQNQNGFRIEIQEFVLENAGV